MSEQELFRELQKTPPLPPWEAFPDLDPLSIGWRMGYGESHLYKLHIYFKYCSLEERAAYEAEHPEPPGWLGWYSDDRDDVGGE